MTHPSKNILGSIGHALKGRTIVLCITGSVAAVRCPEIARELMRHGAEVFCVMSPAAEGLITKDMMEWATGNEVVTRLTGKIEHVALGKKADLVLVCPATANTISKIACGIDDTPVTSVVSVALGLKKTISVVPAMHYSMYDHPVLRENLGKLVGKIGVLIIEPRPEEGKAKVASTKKIVDSVLCALGPNDLKGKRVLVTAGPTIEPIDPMRVITNRSSGKMGLSIARAAFLRGADVTLVCNPAIKADEDENYKTISIETAAEMKSAVLNEVKSSRKFYAVIMAAAPADFAPEKTAAKKISSDGPIALRLKPTEKIIDYVKTASPSTFLVIFKAEGGDGLSETALAEKAFVRLEKSKADIVVANDVAIAGRDNGKIILIDKNKKTTRLAGSKSELADAILDGVLTALR